MKACQNTAAHRTRVVWGPRIEGVRRFGWGGCWVTGDRLGRVGQENGSLTMLTMTAVAVWREGEDRRNGISRRGVAVVVWEGGEGISISWRERMLSDDTMQYLYFNSPSCEASY